MATRATVPSKATVDLNSIQNTPTNGYKGSIFTKVGELMSCDFSVDNSGYRTGTLTANDIIDGTAAIAHAQTAYHSTWHRIADTTTATCTALRNAGNYAYTFGPSGFRSLHGIDSETPMAGLMIMTMQDQISGGGFGGHGTVGNFNAYIAFDPFSTSGSAVVDVKFYQYLRRYYDQCFIDYSTNGTTWSAVEINVTGVDINVNGTYRGWYTATLPLAAANVPNLNIRIRYFSDAVSSRQTQAYGYLWILDDVKAVGGPTNRLTVSENMYYEGFYQLMPKDLQVPMVWTCTFANTGAASQSNVTGKIFTTGVGNNTFTQAASVSAGNIAVSPTTYHEIVIDPLAWYDDTATYHGWGYYRPGTGTPYASLNTSSTGLGKFYADLTSTALTHVYGDTATFDTIAYTVTKGNGSANSSSYGNDGEGRQWGRDNGVLTKFSYWTYGITDDGFVSSDPDETLWSSENYTVWVSYVTGNNIPNDWVIRGMEIVASSWPGMAEAGAKINADVRADSVHENSVTFRSVETGASTHTVTAAELNNTTNLEYLTNGNYNTVYIPFPEQPALMSNTAYRVGYSLAEDGFFSAAANRNFYYDLSDSSAVLFDTTPGMQQFKHTLTIENGYSMLVWDPRPGQFKWLGFNAKQYPMIRMVVGPAQVIPTYTITFQCDGDGEQGYIMDNSYNNLCGTSTTVAEGSQHSYYIMPEEGYIIDKVYVDGQEVEYNVIEGEEGNYGVYEFSGITANHTLRASFLRNEESINTVADCVSMKLQPNPASSNVRLTIKGVSGMVDFALIDMSGRVITSSKINAETAQVIDLSNVAKGAYFVRITNNNMSKVEKLIVR